MKRTISRFMTVFILISVLSLSACGKDGSSPEATSLYSEGLEIVQLMSEMVQSEAYIDLVTGDKGIKSIIQDLADGSYSSPRAVYAISFSDETLLTMAEIDAPDSISENLKSFIIKKTFASLMTQLNAKSGVEYLAVASMCTASKTFANEMLMKM